MCTGRGKCCLQSLFVPNSHIKAMSLLQKEWEKMLSCPSLKFTPYFRHLISILWLNIIHLNIVLIHNSKLHIKIFNLQNHQLLNTISLPDTFLTSCKLAPGTNVLAFFAISRWSSLPFLLLNKMTASSLSFKKAIIIGQRYTNSERVFCK